MTGVECVHGSQWDFVRARVSQKMFEDPGESRALGVGSGRGRHDECCRLGNKLKWSEAERYSVGSKEKERCRSNGAEDVTYQCLMLCEGSIRRFICSLPGFFAKKWLGA